MWNDIDTDDDLLNFNVVADTATNIIFESKDQPVSIGISGLWGTGKSSMLRMIQKSINYQDKEKQYICLQFDAWRYQGYEDAKSALLQQVGSKLLEYAKTHESFRDKINAFVAKIDWFKTIKYLGGAAGAIAGVATGNSAIALVSSLSTIMAQNPAAFFSDKNNVDGITKSLETVKNDFGGLLKQKKEENIPLQIEDFIKRFSDLLKELNIYLVIFVDDLDRCLPDIAISTLEAMRLLLFVPRTAFVIAADDQMIKSAVRIHFKDDGYNDDLVTNYFDKLIQISITVPRLGVNEVKAYIFLLLLQEAVKKATISGSEYAEVKNKVIDSEKQCWSGALTREKIEDICKELKNKLQNEIEIAEEISGIMVSSPQIAGNPRLIKRFLNNLIITEKIMKIQGNTVSLQVLTKLQLFERCSTEKAFNFLLKQVEDSNDGKAEFLIAQEENIRTGQEYRAPDVSWEDKFYENWIKLNPRLYNVDLRPILYFSRNKAVTLASFDELSSEARDIMNAIVQTTKFENFIVEEMQKKLSADEAKKIMFRISSKASVSQWEDKSSIQLLHFPKAFEELQQSYVGIMKNVPVEKIKPSLIPLLDDVWAHDLLDKWKIDQRASKQLVNAIKVKRGEK